MADKSKIIIIKKIKKGHEGHHGGSWKVAYADFVTAMMAFFLLMWLLAMVSPEKRAAIAQYFREFSLFQSDSQSGSSFLQESSQIFDQSGGDVQSSTSAFGKGARELSADALKEQLKKDIEEKLKSLKDQAIVDTFEGGVRIQLVDMEGRPMFLPGGTELTPRAKEILKLVGENMKDLPNRIAIEGHTDAAPLKAGQTTNWELSTQRASSARKELEANHIDPRRIARVVGYADTELLVKDNPKDPRNRRISIILLQPKAQETAQAPKSGRENSSASPEDQPRSAPQATTAPYQEHAVKPVPPAEPAKRQPAPGPAPTQGTREGLIEEIGIKQKPIDLKKPQIAPGIDKSR
ncbi:MAG: flagellar motor protein MotB [Nitrospirota bacterium]